MSIRRDDRGQVTTALMVLVILGLLFVTVQVLLPLGRASDLKERAQAAADAAALAGADDLRRQVITRWMVPLEHEADIANWVGCPTGAGAAADYAARNDARVTRYCYASALDRVQVRVEGRTEINGQRARNQAEAELGIRWASCRWKSVPGSPKTRLWSCPGLEVPFELDHKKLRITVTSAWLEERLTPRLVS